MRLPILFLWGHKEYEKSPGVKLRHPLGVPGVSLLYGVVHGGLHKDLRIRSAKFTDKHFEGIAIGGIYGTKKNLYRIVEWVVDVVSEEKPRHLLGIGEVESLFNAIERGIDLFDCVAPTRRARNGSLYVSPKSGVYYDRLEYHNNNFTINIRQTKWIQDTMAVDPTCSCYTCQNFSRAYLNYLYKSGEILYHSLATFHNVFFILNLLKNIRNTIKVGAFGKLKEEYMGT